MSVSPPRPKHLPMNALKAFEAAARLGGFNAAAQELGVTAGAISAHIKSLEEDLGAPLFSRSAQGVTLTALGATVKPAFSDAFDALGQAVQVLRSQAGPRVVHIAALPAVAQFWLSPRLPRLRHAMPEVEISITALETPPNLKRTPYDLCVFYDDSKGDVLSDDVIFPVCAPDIAARITKPDQLQDFPCITDSGWPDDWQDWTKQACPNTPFTPRGPVFSLYSLAIEETINGAGVLIGHEALIAPLLTKGQLVAPFAHQKVSLPRQLRIWSPRSIPANTPAAKVRDGLKNLT